MVSQKHAYCIMAHDDQYCLETLLKLLDHPRNDIFLHIDAKSNSFNEDKLHTSLSNFYILPEEKRIDVRWGGLSQVRAELNLFKCATDTDDYSYVHLISGADLPLKSQEEIHHFFDSLEENSNIVTFSHGKAIDENVDFKTKFYHPFVEYQRLRKNGNIMHVLQVVSAKTWRKMFVTFQRIIRYKRDWKNLEIKKGSNWVSISSQFAEFLVNKENYILDNFKGVICPDEIFLHTLLYNSPFQPTIWDYENKKRNIRKIDWERGSPYVWQEDDFNELIQSDALFARKFSSKTDKEIINKIFSYLTS